jgi:hypothetical protein
VSTKWPFKHTAALYLSGGCTLARVDKGLHRHEGVQGTLREMPLECSVEECFFPQKCNGLCSGHNERRRTGKPIDGPLRRYATQDPALRADGLRLCNGPCGLTKPFTEFYRNEWLCKVCSKARAVAYKRTNPEWNRAEAKLYRERYPEKNKAQRQASAKRNVGTRRAYRLKNTYGMTVEQYESMLDEQDGRCAICRSDRPGGPRTPIFTVDHDHDTGRVRGLLCSSCNRALGLLRDDPEVLRLAIGYLERCRGGSDRPLTPDHRDGSRGGQRVSVPTP